MTIALLGGTFDLFHPGHVRFLKWTKEHFDWVIPALNTDDFVKRFKGKAPIQSLEERRETLLACRYVDDVIVNSGDEDFKPAIFESQATHLVEGSDWTLERILPQWKVTEKFLVEHHLTVVFCPLPRIFSSTELRNRILRNV